VIGDGSEVWIVVAHGSRAPGTVSDHAEVCSALHDKAGDEVVAVMPAFLEISEPSIPDAIDAAAARGAGRIVLLPYFLHAGNHMRRDIPALVDEARTRHPDVELTLADHLGPDGALVDILLQRARAARRRTT
jgi:sirohydrochlorin ferrochelatase